MKGNKAMTEEKMEAIIDEYTGGVPVAEILEKHGINNGDLKRIRDMYGIPLRKPLKVKSSKCMLPMEAFACYEGKCRKCGWDAEVHERRVSEINGEN